MSIAKTTRPHLLTREAAAARIEALEAALREARQLVTEANNSLYGSQGYFHSLNGGPFNKYHLAEGIENLKATSNRDYRRIEALEAALRACVQYHVKAAADNRAIAAVNQNNDLGENSLNHAVDHEIAAEDIGNIVRAALALGQDK